MESTNFGNNGKVIGSTLFFALVMSKIGYSDGFDIDKLSNIAYYVRKRSVPIGVSLVPSPRGYESHDLADVCGKALAFGYIYDAFPIRFNESGKLVCRKIIKAAEEQGLAGLIKNAERLIGNAMSELYNLPSSQDN